MVKVELTKAEWKLIKLTVGDYIDNCKWVGYGLCPRCEIARELLKKVEKWLK